MHKRKEGQGPGYEGLMSPPLKVIYDVRRRCRRNPEIGRLDIWTLGLLDIWTFRPWKTIAFPPFAYDVALAKAQRRD